MLVALVVAWPPNGPGDLRGGQTRAREGAENYVKTGTEDIYPQSNCLGTPKSSDVFEWICILKR